MTLPDTTLRAQIAADPGLAQRIDAIAKHGRHGEGRTAETCLIGHVDPAALAWAVAGNASIFAEVRDAVGAADPEATNVVPTAVAGISDNDLIYAVTQATRTTYGLGS